MSEREILAAEPRAITGKKVKKLRKSGFIPAIVYGRRDPMSIKLPRRETMRVLRRAGRTNLIDVQLPDDQFTVLARDIQQHPTRGEVLHIDFYEVNMKETIVVDVDLVLEGMAPPEADGLGNVVLATKTMAIQGMPADLVSEIVVDATLLQGPDQTIFAGDISLPPGIELAVEDDLAVARFVFKREEEEEEEEDALYDDGELTAMAVESDEEEDE